jgi:hypothetical protein
VTEKVWPFEWRTCKHCNRSRSRCQEVGPCKGWLDHQQIMADFAADGVVEVVNIAGYYEVVQ